MEVIDALESSYKRAAEVVGNVGADQLSQPSPCAEWDLRATLNHLIGATWMFALVNQGQSGIPEDAGDVVGDDPGAALAEAGAANVTSWQQPGGLEGDRTYPFGTFPASAAAMINLGEVVVHTWDVCCATGQDATIDPDPAEMLLGFYSNIPLDAYREHGAFGAEIAVPATSPAPDRLLGLLGRQP